jgi:hypothetical protein
MMRVRNTEMHVSSGRIEQSGRVRWAVAQKRCGTIYPAQNQAEASGSTERSKDRERQTDRERERERETEREVATWAKT